jgi:hypothetical protein
MNSRYFDNDLFENLVNQVCQKETRILGGILIGPSDNNDYIEMWERLLTEKKKEIKDMEIAISLLKLANELKVKYVDSEEDK